MAGTNVSYWNLISTDCCLGLFYKSLLISTVYIGPDYWIYTIKHPDSAMKRLFDAVVSFFKREWFLFVAIFAIIVIITVFELL